jgi:tRNA A37 methylthiotransferase MiaB
MKKVFIKTFGCQMNEYDSDKMADVMNAAQGYEATHDVEEADLILFNTCSVREKAQEKVFSDLGRVKHLKKKGVLIGVGGCVASQEGAASSSAHRMSMWCSARRRCTGCPTCCAGVRSNNCRRSISASPRSKNSTACRRREWMDAPPS